eukprot:TRINITY_DN313_c0_g1_i10.p1 TRINITY_DN313_c0_g1~~TRINITY_DN313_c0_g1_i10.p1  ORF type:complete len:3068 (+),score=1126.87 TRINITY_DN313_c0_g1_i10:247-9204(+)
MEGELDANDAKVKSLEDVVVTLQHELGAKARDLAEIASQRERVRSTGTQVLVTTESVRIQAGCPLADTEQRSIQVAAEVSARGQQTDVLDVTHAAAQVAPDAVTVGVQQDITVANSCSQTGGDTLTQEVGVQEGPDTEVRSVQTEVEVRTAEQQTDDSEEAHKDVGVQEVPLTRMKEVQTDTEASCTKDVQTELEQIHTASQVSIDMTTASVQTEEWGVSKDALEVLENDLKKAYDEIQRLSHTLASGIEVDSNEIVVSRAEGLNERLQALLHDDTATQEEIDACIKEAEDELGSINELVGPATEVERLKKQLAACKKARATLEGDVAALKTEMLEKDAATRTLRAENARLLERLSSSVNHSELEALREANAALKEKVDALVQQLDASSSTSDSRRGTHNTELLNLEVHNAELSADLSAAQSRIAALEAALKEAQTYHGPAPSADDVPGSVVRSHEVVPLVLKEKPAEVQQQLSHDDLKAMLQGMFSDMEEARKEREKEMLQRIRNLSEQGTGESTAAQIESVLKSLDKPDTDTGVAERLDDILRQQTALSENQDALRDLLHSMSQQMPSSSRRSSLAESTAKILPLITALQASLENLARSDSARQQEMAGTLSEVKDLLSKEPQDDEGVELCETAIEGLVSKLREVLEDVKGSKDDRQEAAHKEVMSMLTALQSQLQADREHDQTAEKLESITRRLSQSGHQSSAIKQFLESRSGEPASEKFDTAIDLLQEMHRTMAQSGTQPTVEHLDDLTDAIRSDTTAKKELANLLSSVERALDITQELKTPSGLMPDWAATLLHELREGQGTSAPSPEEILAITEQRKKMAETEAATQSAELLRLRVASLEEQLASSELREWGKQRVMDSIFDENRKLKEELKNTCDINLLTQAHQELAIARMMPTHPEVGSDKGSEQEYLKNARYLTEQLKSSEERVSQLREELEIAMRRSQHWEETARDYLSELRENHKAMQDLEEHNRELRQRLEAAEAGSEDTFHYGQRSNSIFSSRRGSIPTGEDVPSVSSEVVDEEVSKLTGGGPTESPHTGVVSPGPDSGMKKSRTMRSVAGPGHRRRSSYSETAAMQERTCTSCRQKFVTTKLDRTLCKDCFKQSSPQACSPTTQSTPPLPLLSQLPPESPKRKKKAREPKMTEQLRQHLRDLDIAVAAEKEVKSRPGSSQEDITAAEYRRQLEAKAILQLTPDKTGYLTSLATKGSQGDLSASLRRVTFKDDEDSAIIEQMQARIEALENELLQRKNEPETWLDPPRLLLERRKKQEEAQLQEPTTPRSLELQGRVKVLQSATRKREHELRDLIENVNNEKQKEQDLKRRPTALDDLKENMGVELKKAQMLNTEAHQLRSERNMLEAAIEEAKQPTDPEQETVVITARSPELQLLSQQACLEGHTTANTEEKSDPPAERSPSSKSDLEWKLKQLHEVDIARMKEMRKLNNELAALQARNKEIEAATEDIDKEEHELLLAEKATLAAHVEKLTLEIEALKNQNDSLKLKQSPTARDRPAVTPVAQVSTSHPLMLVGGMPDGRVESGFITEHEELPAEALDSSFRQMKLSVTDMKLQQLMYEPDSGERKRSRALEEALREEVTELTIELESSKQKIENLIQLVESKDRVIQQLERDLEDSSEESLKMHRQTAALSASLRAIDSAESLQEKGETFAADLEVLRNMIASQSDVKDINALLAKTLLSKDELTKHSEELHRADLAKMQEMENEIAVLRARLDRRMSASQRGSKSSDLLEFLSRSDRQKKETSTPNTPPLISVRTPETWSDLSASHKSHISVTKLDPITEMETSVRSEEEALLKQSLDYEIMLEKMDQGESEPLQVTLMRLSESREKLASEHQNLLQQTLTDKEARDELETTLVRIQTDNEKLRMDSEALEKTVVHLNKELARCKEKLAVAEARNLVLGNVAGASDTQDVGEQSSSSSSSSSREEPPEDRTRALEAELKQLKEASAMLEAARMQEKEKDENTIKLLEEQLKSTNSVLDAETLAIQERVSLQEDELHEAQQVIQILNEQRTESDAVLDAMRTKILENEEEIEKLTDYIANRQYDYEQQCKRVEDLEGEISALTMTKREAEDMQIELEEKNKQLHSDLQEIKETGSDAEFDDLRKQLAAKDELLEAKAKELDDMRGELEKLQQQVNEMVPKGEFDAVKRKLELADARNLIKDNVGKATFSPDSPVGFSMPQQQIKSEDLGPLLQRFGLLEDQLKQSKHQVEELTQGKNQLEEQLLSTQKDLKRVREARLEPTASVMSASIAVSTEGFFFDNKEDDTLSLASPTLTEGGLSPKETMLLSEIETRDTKLAKLQTELSDCREKLAQSEAKNLLLSGVTESLNPKEEITTTPMLQMDFGPLLARLGEKKEPSSRSASEATDALQVANERIKELEDKLEETTSESAAKLLAANEDIKNLKEQIDSMKQRELDLKDSLHESRSMPSGNLVDFTMEDSQKKLVDSHKSEVEALQSEINTLNSEIAQLKEGTPLVDFMTNKMQQIESEAKEAQQRASSLSSENDKLSEHNKALTQAVDDLRREISASPQRSEHDRLQSHVTSQSEKIIILQEQLVLLQSTLGTNNSQTDALQQKVADLEGEKADLEGRLRDAAEDLEKAKAKPRDDASSSSSSSSDGDKPDERVRALEDEVAALKDELDASNAKMGPLEVEVAALNEQLDKLEGEHANELAAAKDEHDTRADDLHTLEDQVAELQATLKELVDDTLANLRSENAELREQIRMLVDKVEALMADEGKLEEMERELASMTDELSANKDKAASLEDEVTSLREQLAQASQEDPELRKECDALQQKVADLEGEKADLEGRLRDAAEDLEKAKAKPRDDASSSSSSSSDGDKPDERVRALEDEVAALKDELDASKAKVGPLEEEVAALKEQLAQSTRTAQEDPDLRKEHDALQQKVADLEGEKADLEGMALKDELDASNSVMQQRTLRRQRRSPVTMPHHHHRQVTVTSLMSVCGHSRMKLLL